MRVLFLALGDDRQRAVVSESARVVAGGGSATVVVDQAARWQRTPFASGVDVVEATAELGGHRRARFVQRALPYAEQLVLYRGPRFLLYRVIGHGPLKKPADRAARAYQRRIADRIHRRLYEPLHSRLWDAVRFRAAFQRVTRAEPFDWVIVSDALSIPDAARLLDGAPRLAGSPRLAYGMDYIGGFDGPG